MVDAMPSLVGCIGPEEVLIAVLENNGHVTVVPKRKTVDTHAAQE